MKINMKTSKTKSSAFRVLLTFACFVAVSAVLVSAHAAEKKAAASEETAAQAASTTAAAPEALASQPANGAAKKKTTDVSFEDVLVQGKYHFSDEAVTTVEQDKILDALLGIRTDFKDRLKKSSARH